MSEFAHTARMLIASLAAETAMLEAGSYAAAIAAAQPKVRALEAFVALRGTAAVPGSEQLLRQVSQAAAANRDALSKALGIQGRVVTILARVAHGAASETYAPTQKAVAAPAALSIQT